MNEAKEKDFIVEKESVDRDRSVSPHMARSLPTHGVQHGRAAAPRLQLRIASWAAIYALFVLVFLPGLFGRTEVWAEQGPMPDMRIFKTDDEGLREVVPGTFIKHMNGKDLTVALIKVVKKKGAGEEPVPRHTHGEEAVVFLKGKVKWRIGGEDLSLEPGDVMLIPAGLPHGSADAVLEDGQAEILQIVTPPRPELGQEGATTNPYGKASAQLSKADEEAAPKQKVRVFKTDDEGLREVIPGTWIKHIYGKDLSLALFKIRKVDGTTLQAPLHTHGEEVALIMKGKGSMRVGGKDYQFEPGDALFILAGVPHGGSGAKVEGDESMVLSIITPPRREFGPEGTTANPYKKLQEGQQPTTQIGQ